MLCFVVNSDAFGACSSTNITGYTNWTSATASNMPSSSPLIIYWNNTANQRTFSFVLSAQGTFYIDWGNSSYSKIVKSNTNSQRYINQYGTANGVKTIKIYGPATAYNANQPAITFTKDTSRCGDSNIGTSADYIYGVAGCLGCVFPTLSSGTNKQPIFYGTFSSLQNFGCYPAQVSGMPPTDFFNGITGTAVANQFSYMFAAGGCDTGCFGRTNNVSTSGVLPVGWFSGLTGANSQAFSYMFQASASCQ